MNKILEGVARAICLAIWDHDYTPRDPKYPDVRWIWAMDAAKAGAGFLADNVTDEMVEAMWADYHANNGSGRHMLSAALRAAAVGGWWVMGWQPISTAPKDPNAFGLTPQIMLHAPTVNKSGPIICEGYWRLSGVPGWVSCMDPNVPRPHLKPTHWMPLPPPPPEET